MKTSVGFNCVHYFSIVENINDLKNIKENKHTTESRSHLHTRLQYNFYWLLIIQLKLITNNLNMKTK